MLCLTTTSYQFFTKPKKEKEERKKIYSMSETDRQTSMFQLETPEQIHLGKLHIKKIRQIDEFLSNK